MQLTGRQRKILREGIIGAYPTRSELQILLAEEMDVELNAIAKGNDYNTEVFNLIRDFEAEGRLEEFVGGIVRNKAKSPSLKVIISEFNSILEQEASNQEKKFMPLETNQEVLEGTTIGNYVLNPQVKKQLSEATKLSFSGQDNLQSSKLDDLLELHMCRQEVTLIDEGGNHYNELKDLLSAQKWEEADLKTWSLMLQLTGHPDKESLSESETKNFPCKNLKLIDGLWQEFSRGKFGFSKQKEIWISVGGQCNLKTVERLGDKVGWRREQEWLEYPFIDFSLRAPEGHLPLWRFGRRNYQLVYALMRKLADCRINCQEIKSEASQQYYPTSSNMEALKIWREKLAYLQSQEAIAANPGVIFELRKQIEECQQKIEELRG